MENIVCHLLVCVGQQVKYVRKKYFEVVDNFQTFAFQMLTVNHLLEQLCAKKLSGVGQKLARHPQPACKSVPLQTTAIGQICAI